MLNVFKTVWFKLSLFSGSFCCGLKKKAYIFIEPVTLFSITHFLKLFSTFNTLNILKIMLTK